MPLKTVEDVREALKTLSGWKAEVQDGPLINNCQHYEIVLMRTEGAFTKRGRRSKLEIRRMAEIDKLESQLQDLKALVSKWQPMTPSERSSVRGETRPVAKAEAVKAEPEVDPIDLFMGTIRRLAKERGVKLEE